MARQLGDIFSWAARLKGTLDTGFPCGVVGFLAFDASPLTSCLQKVGDGVLSERSTFEPLFFFLPLMIDGEVKWAIRLFHGIRSSLFKFFISLDRTAPWILLVFECFRCKPTASARLFTVPGFDRSFLKFQVLSIYFICLQLYISPLQLSGLISACVQSG